MRTEATKKIPDGDGALAQGWHARDLDKAMTSRSWLQRERLETEHRHRAEQRPS
jgi:hypothetical protein